MKMTREQWLEWAKGLKPGDKVCVSFWGRLYVESVKRITAKMWIVTDGGNVFYQGKYDTRFVQRGGYGNIIPWSEELQKKADEEEAKRRKEEEEERTIRAAKNICYDLAYGKNGRMMTFDLAKKIIESVADEQQQTKGGKDNADN